MPWVSKPSTKVKHHGRQVLESIKEKSKKDKGRQFCETHSWQEKVVSASFCGCTEAIRPLTFSNRS
jgi:predicted nucleic acid-binding Zn finger protein